MADEPTTAIDDNDSAEKHIETDEQVIEDVLVEEVSIDGMCGVY